MSRAWLQDLEEKVQETVSCLRQLRSERYHLARQVEDLEEQLGEAQQQDTLLADLESRAATANEAEEKLAAMTTRVAELESRLAEGDASLLQEQELLERVAALETRLKEARQDAEDLRQQNAQLSSELKGGQKTSKEVESLRRDKADLETELREARDEASEQTAHFEAKIAQLEGELEAGHSAARELEERLAEHQAATNGDETAASPDHWQQERREIRQRLESLTRHLEGLLEV